MTQKHTRVRTTNRAGRAIVGTEKTEHNYIDSAEIAGSFCEKLEETEKIFHHFEIISVDLLVNCWITVANPLKNY